MAQSISLVFKELLQINSITIGKEMGEGHEYTQEEKFKIQNPVSIFNKAKQ